MEQLVLPGVAALHECSTGEKGYIVQAFSADAQCAEDARMALEEKYEPLLEVTDRFDRRSVSYQLSKKAALHSWLKYKEGFSADLVNALIDYMGVMQGETIMDPFMGSGTTALVCKMRGINSIGYDILPISRVSIKAKANVMKYDVSEIERLLRALAALDMPDGYNGRTPYVKITDTAYPDFNERFIQFATDWIQKAKFSSKVKNLFTLCMLNSLEPCSYTSKIGQYLGWDSRSRKVICANMERKEKGRKLLPLNYCRDTIGNIKDVLLSELNHVLLDISSIQSARQNCGGDIEASINFMEDSVLFGLPKIADDCIDGVITSPPYCNRYDYTRTYALELVYLGLGEDAIKKLRQSLLSCTVESKSKIEVLGKHYSEIGAGDRFDCIQGVIRSNAAFSETMRALHWRRENGDLNNNGVIRMVEGYFTELAFVYAELYRVCRKGAMVAFVNDNVRYGGEVIPVDCISTSLAEGFGFTPMKIYCLKQQKGNSSQQMKKYGRVPLRKSITVWVKQ